MALNRRKHTSAWHRVSQTDLTTLLNEGGFDLLDGEQEADITLISAESFSCHRESFLPSQTWEIIDYDVPSNAYTEIAFNGNIDHNNDYVTYYMGFKYSINDGAMQQISYHCTTAGNVTISPFVLPLVSAGDNIKIYAFDTGDQNAPAGVNGSAYLKATKIKNYSIVDA